MAKENPATGGVLHVAPGYSAGQSLREALYSAGRDDDVVCFPDDLSRGPIAADDPSIRANLCGEEWRLGERLRHFWATVEDAPQKLIVWFSRRSAMELAFWLAFAERAGEWDYRAVDVTGRRLCFYHPSVGETLETQPTMAVSLVPPAAFLNLLGSEKTVSEQERLEARRQWRRLKAEDAPFRIVGPDGLVSAPEDCFDPAILAHVTPQWQKLGRVIGETLADLSNPYIQVGDLALIDRAVALIAAGTVLVDGDPMEIHSCKVRTPPG